MNTPLALAQQCLNGLSVGDAFGELFFHHSPHTTTFNDIANEEWVWTDDTHMALSIVETLKSHGAIDQDVLAQAFARRFADDPYRGYGRGAARLLDAINNGAYWKSESASLFGTGSFGNGAAMRVAPVGAYFSNDLSRAADEAERSAVVTHAHPEGIAGAIAVAIAAALAARQPYPSGVEFIKEVLSYTPASTTKERMLLSRSIAHDNIGEAILKLGTGMEVSAQDTVPFCIWTAAYHLDNFESALWATVKGGGDSDTTSAIVGGIVALSSKNIPAGWLAKREPIPDI